MNTEGRLLRFTSFGESHGVGIGGVIDGVPAGLKIDFDFINDQIARRKGGMNIYSTPRKEADEVEFLSGIFQGFSTGMPIGFLVRNQNQKSKDYSELAEVFRPSHADFTYLHKYGIRDFHGGGRSSARESVARVVAGSIARLILEQIGVKIYSGVFSVGEIKADNIDFDHAKNSEIFSLDPKAQKAQKDAILQALKDKDSIGACVLLKACHVPIGLGEVLYDKLDARIASVMMGLNAVKAVEIGDGVQISHARASKVNDQMDSHGFISNHSGGILGGISNGEDILIKVHFKPTPSIFQTQSTQDIHQNHTFISIKGRHDPCVGIRGSVVAEAMLSLVLADFALLNLSSKMENFRRFYAN